MSGCTGCGRSRASSPGKGSPGQGRAACSRPLSPKCCGPGTRQRRRTRAGHVYLILSRELLRQAEGVFLLLEYWGGEALYGLHEDDPHVAAALRSVGVPCLVEAPPAGAIDGYCSPGARAMRVFLAARASSSGS